jgi:two-component system chemotaxis response regulator CheY
MDYGSGYKDNRPRNAAALETANSPLSFLKKESALQKKILVVDDAAVVRHVVSITLKKAGYEIIEAVNGKDALSKLARNTVNMVITDLNMPEMDGIELIREIRKTDGHKFMPVVMLTTVSQEDRKKEGKLAGASGWIFKPFQSKELIDTVKKFVT